MKVEGPSSSTQAAHRRAERVVAPGFSIPTQEIAQQQFARPVASTQSMVNVGSLLALQAMPETKEEKKKRLTKRANDLLDNLEEIKIASLTGSLNPSHLANLKANLSGGLEDIEDPELQNVLQAIEQRAAVELAKLERAF